MRFQSFNFFFTYIDILGNNWCYLFVKLGKVPFTETMIKFFKKVMDQIT